MDQQLQVDDKPKQLTLVAYAPRPVDPRAKYDGQMFLADRPMDLVYIKRHVTDPVVRFTDQGLISDGEPLKLQPNPFYIPTLPTQ